MKFCESKFEEYIKKYRKNNLHPELESIFKQLPNNIENHPNLILYGPSGVGKYTQALQYISNFSNTNLKYERKTTIKSQKTKNFIFKISDIHYEVNMEILGCNAKILWNDIYHNIIDMISTTPNLQGFILCKNFHTIHSELLENFHTYMQTLCHTKIKICFILISEQVSFLPKNMLDRSYIIPVRRPTKALYEKCVERKIDKKKNKIDNIKLVKKAPSINLNYSETFIDNILYQLLEEKPINFMQFRENIYNIIVFNIDIFECIYKILYKLSEKKKIKQKNMVYIFKELFIFLRRYNNNYRPIYHIEYFLLILHQVINE
jgi:hypothetical protein